jgi:hypothetical protein
MTQHSAQQNALYFFLDTLYYNVLLSVQHVSIHHGITIRDSYQIKIPQKELAIYTSTHNKKIQKGDQSGLF